MPYDPIEFSKKIAGLVNRGRCRRANKVRVWGRGYSGVATADRRGYGGTAIAERNPRGIS